MFGYQPLLGATTHPYSSMYVEVDNNIIIYFLWHTVILEAQSNFNYTTDIQCQDFFFDRIHLSQGSWLANPDNIFFFKNDLTNKQLL